ncbi:DNA-directed RNA polymerase III subunit RPC7 [Drosophila guanche]|uniref:Blast:DNA-directed RNA polymerase III subunit RPC7 n=1 Tax=Drosophila guanche TaxID=7266 RepID=A0A3B0K3Q6_DROGU|nr:DNA-directed RNA polymerase III subunit RPC7 [Drosophila guanche]SPP87312.1 blast:DNA-directed RNA polymerase III subunit RPC7 [Drosophila guanche]
MAGRGRGGKTGTLTAEQLAMLGCVKDMPVQSAPQPTFPPVMNKPIAVETTTAQNYQLLWKEQFLNRMRDSPYYIVSACQDKQHLEHKDWRERALERMKLKSEPEFNYKAMPRELNTTNRKRRGADARPKLLAKKTNIEDRLKALEQKELKTGTENEQDDAKKESDSEQEDELDEEAALDDEMDDENDYGNSYFDNGEAYNDEDDNLDDGPVI